MTLSAVLICKNEEAAIERVLSSVSWADEIVVVDSGSDDKTVELARRFTPKVFTRPFTDYADQKNYAVSLAAGDWVLSVDADEEVPEALRAEICGAIQSGSAEAFRIPRRSSMFGRWMKYSGTQDDAPLRLFKRGRTRYINPIHEEVVVDGRCGSLRSLLKHYTYPTLASYLARFNRYTSMESRFIRDQQKVALSRRELMLGPLAVFAKLYVWRRGFCDGIQGFFFCVLSAYYFFAKHAKRWELDRLK